MKKLMIAAAIAFAAVAIQAATISWTLSGVNNGGKATSGLMYVFANETVARTTILALAETGATAVQSALDDITETYVTSYSNGSAWLDPEGSSKPSNSTFGLGDSKSANMYALCFDTDTITDESNFYVTDLKKIKTASGESNKAFLWDDQTSLPGGAWNAVADVPEPTSGLLLLLGMAGLALRRRRA